MIYLKRTSCEDITKLFDCELVYLFKYIIRDNSGWAFFLLRIKKNGEIHNIKNPSVYSFEELRGRQITIL